MEPVRAWQQCPLITLAIIVKTNSTLLLKLFGVGNCDYRIHLTFWLHPRKVMPTKYARKGHTYAHTSQPANGNEDEDEYEEEKEDKDEDERGGEVDVDIKGKGKVGEEDGNLNAATVVVACAITGGGGGEIKIDAAPRLPSLCPSIMAPNFSDEDEETIGAWIWRSSSSLSSLPVAPSSFFPPLKPLPSLLLVHVHEINLYVLFNVLFRFTVLVNTDGIVTVVVVIIAIVVMIRLLVLLRHCPLPPFHSPQGGVEVEEQAKLRTVTANVRCKPLPANQAVVSATSGGQPVSPMMLQRPVHQMVITAEALRVLWLKVVDCQK